MAFPGDIIKNYLSTSNTDLTNRPTERTLSKSLSVVAFKYKHSPKKFSHAGASYKCPNHSTDESQGKSAKMSSQQCLKSPALPVYCLSFV